MFPTFVNIMCLIGGFVLGALAVLIIRENKVASEEKSANESSPGFITPKSQLKDALPEQERIKRLSLISLCEEVRNGVAEYLFEFYLSTFLDKAKAQPGMVDETMVLAFLGQDLDDIDEDLQIELQDLYRKVIGTHGVS